MSSFQRRLLAAFPAVNITPSMASSSLIQLPLPKVKASFAAKSVQRSTKVVCTASVAATGEQLGSFDTCVCFSSKMKFTF